MNQLCRISLLGSHTIGCEPKRGTDQQNFVDYQREGDAEVVTWYSCNTSKRYQVQTQVSGSRRKVRGYRIIKVTAMLSQNFNYPTQYITVTVLKYPLVVIL